jgi:hypothetical protein
MARILVGVPLFRVADLARRFLNSVAGTPVDIVIVDNNADADVKQVIKGFSKRATVLTSPENTFCNGGWNRIMQHALAGDYDIVGLGSSDVTMVGNWYSVLVDRWAMNLKEVWIPSLTPIPSDVYATSIAGFTSFLPRAAVEHVYPIPAGLRHWFGDQYMFEKLRRAGWSTVVPAALRAEHEWSAVTARTPEAYGVIEQDKIAWRGYENLRVCGNIGI